MNEHYTGIGPTLANNLPTPKKLFTEFLDKSKSPATSFFFCPTSPNEVKLQILSMSNNKSYGFYSCPVSILKHASDIALGTFPSKLKMAKVIPIFKSDDNTDPNNYRPISLFSCFHRIFEKLVYKRMKSFIEEKNILSTSQYGFRKGLQGSVLGPLLFLLYVNDIYSGSNKLNFYLFADDTNILYSHKNLKSLEK